MSRVPKRRELVSGETNQAAAEMLEAIQSAESEQELLLEIERYHRGQAAMLAILAAVQAAFVRRLRELMEGDE